MTRREDRLNPQRTDADVRRILELVVEVRVAWEQVVDSGSYSSGGELPTLGRGFSDSRPTESIAMAPTKRQARQAARRAARLVTEAREALQEASDSLHAGLLRTDPEVLFEFVERRSAVLEGQ